MAKQPPAERDTPLSSQVLEYYRNYSQSHQLPRYLCGEVPNAAIITNLVQGYCEIEDHNIESASTIHRPPAIGQDHSLISVMPPLVIITDVDNRSQLSPTSSVTSNRKLEWDNGADIGYENCEVSNRSLFKSSSLPDLNSLERNIQKDILRHSPDGRISETTRIHIVNNNSNSTTDSSTKILETAISIATTTGYDNPIQKTSASGQSSSITISPKKKVFTSSSANSEPSSELYNSSSRQQNIIYIPVLVQSPPLAESTPNISEKQLSEDSVYYETPVVVHPRKPPRKNAIFITQKTPQKLKSASFDNLQNLQLLNETVEQRNIFFQKYLAGKQQNLCITKTAALEYTHKSAKDNATIAIQTEDVESSKRELIYLDHYVSDKEYCSSTDDSSKIVDCNSFEYLYGSAIVQEEKLTAYDEDAAVGPSSEHEVQTNTQVGKQEIVQDFISNTLMHSKAKSDLTNVTSTESVSSESKSAKISSKLSNNLITDVEKSVALLIRLLNSTKYDEDSKKYYVRKIISKIVDSKYEDDKTTSTTSSISTNKPTSESNTCETSDQTKTDPPLILPGNRKAKSETDLQAAADIYPRLQRNPRFTLTNNEFFVGQNKGDDNDNSSSDLFRPHSRHVFPSYTTDSSLEKMQDTNRSSSSQSWKDDKTASERLMESQRPITEDSDELVGFARRERESQLNWISSEINHLSKLKLLLEKKEFIPDATQSTAVYMITTDKTSRGLSRQTCNCRNRLNIPNVISTNKTPGHHHIKLQRCSHDQQEYKIKQLHCDYNQCNHHNHHASSSCQYHQPYARRIQRTGPSSVKVMPCSSYPPGMSNQIRKEQCDTKQNIEQQNVQEDFGRENQSPICTCTGVTCTLLPSRAAIVASKQEQNISKSPRNDQEPPELSRSSQQTVVHPESTSRYISSTCTLLPSRTAIFASEEKQNSPESPRDVQGLSGRSPSPLQIITHPKNTFVPISNTILSSRATIVVPKQEQNRHESLRNAQGRSRSPQQIMTLPNSTAGSIASTLLPPRATIVDSKHEKNRPESLRNVKGTSGRSISPTEIITLPKSTSVPIPSTLIPSRATIVASKQGQNRLESQRNVQGPSVPMKSQQQSIILSKSESSSKKRSVKVPLQSESSTRKMETFSASKGVVKNNSDFVNKPTLISSHVFQSNEHPTTSVRRYVFEIPIVDLHTSQEASSKVRSSDFGVNKKEIDLGHVANTDFEVRNAHLIQEDEKKEDERKRKHSAEMKQHKTNQKDELKQLMVQRSEDATKSLPGKIIKGASFDIGPSISREVLPSEKSTTTGSISMQSANEFEVGRSSLYASTSILKDYSTSNKPNEKSKIPQNDEIRLNYDEKIQEMDHKVSRRSGSLVNNVSKRSTGSQTLSLENYMKKLIAEAMDSNNWSRRKLSSHHAKTIVNSDKDSSKQGRNNNINEDANSDSSSRKTSNEDTNINDNVKSYPPSRRISNEDSNINDDVKSGISSRRTSNEKTTTDSDKESNVQSVDDTLRSNRMKSDSFSKRKSIEKISKVHPEWHPANDYHRSLENYRTATDDIVSDYISNPNTLISIQNHLDDRELVKNVSSDVFVPRGTSNVTGIKEHVDDMEHMPEEIASSSVSFIRKESNNFERIEKKHENPARKYRSSEKYPKEISSDKVIVSSARGSKSKDLPDSIKMAPNMSKTPLQEDGINRVKEASSRSDKSKVKVTKNMEMKSEHEQNDIVNRVPMEKDDSRSNSSELKLISDKSSPTSTSSDDTTKICQCCRSNNTWLGNFFTDAIHHPLCQACYQVHQHSLWRNNQPFYMFPNHICNCHTLIKTQQIQAIRTTINQLQNLECNQQSACICPPHEKLSQQNNKCLTCNCLIKSHKSRRHDTTSTRISSTKHNSKDERHKHTGITYTLKLDTATEDDATEDKLDQKLLERYEEEIVVKVPNKRSRAIKKSSIDKGQKDKNREQSGGEEKENGRAKNKEIKKNRKKNTKTLQEYLCTNHPAFIESAEQRRRCLIELAYMREERCQKYKQLLAMTTGVPVMVNGQNPQNKGFTIQKPRIFSTKEMKRLTAKNYKKLPEVQQRLLDNKGRQLKKANRLLSDIFNKKLRDKVLKGQPSLSTSVSVINLM